FTGAVITCIAITALELTGPLGPPSIGLARARYPERACDFMETHGVRGRGFNLFFMGGYQIYRFWPERDRLPFMDIHMAGTQWDRDHYLLAQSDPSAWRTLDSRYRFDYVLLGRQTLEGETLTETLDADSAWTMVFTDDVAFVYVRRPGPLEEVARR